MVSEELVKLDVFLPKAPNRAVSQMDALHNLLDQAGLTAIRSKEITVTRTFVDFATFWENTWLSPNRRNAREKVSNTVLEHVKIALRRAWKLTVMVAFRSTAHLVLRQALRLDENDKPFPTISAMCVFVKQGGTWKITF